MALADQFSGQSKGKRAISVRRIVLLALAALLLLVLAGYLVGLFLTPLYKSLQKADLEWLYFALTGVASFLVSFMLTSFYAQGSIFEAKDNEMLLSMPIRPSAILGSRLSALYFLNFFFAAAFMAAAGIVKLTCGGTAAAGGVIVYVLCVFLLALISTTLSCLLGWAVSFVTRRLRNKAMFQLVFSLLLLGGFYVFFFGDITRHLKTITDNSAGIADMFRGALYPFHAMGMACAGKGFTEFLIFAAVCIVPVACSVPGTQCAHVITRRPGSAMIFSQARPIQLDDPRQQYVTPGATAPAPTPAQLPSPPPAATGVPARSPVASAASAVTPPRIAVDGTGSGILSSGISAADRISSDQRKVLRSKAFVLLASE